MTETRFVPSNSTIDWDRVEKLAWIAAGTFVTAAVLRHIGYPVASTGMHMLSSAHYNKMYPVRY